MAVVSLEEDSEGLPATAVAAARASETATVLVAETSLIGFLDFIVVCCLKLGFYRIASPLRVNAYFWLTPILPTPATARIPIGMANANLEFSFRKIG